MVLLSVICWTVSVLGQSKVKISRDGGYSNIVIKFDSDVNQHFCAQYIRRLQVSLSFRDSEIILILMTKNNTLSCKAKDNKRIIM